ncbi:putative nicotinamide N-methyltransferase [Aspergillus lucknowensis]|uniref:Nicotinamide N-methyltransferase n=1 Tax=Aspergillus lucknowensis TaxID=176173 RepID=A0ABR4LVW3_9EURO
MIYSRIRPLPRHLTTHPPPSSSSITAPGDEDASDESPDEIFTSSLSHLFPDDAPQCYGDPGQRLLYSSPRYGDIALMVPTYPSESEDQDRRQGTAGAAGDAHLSQVEEGRKLFAHILWSAGIVVAEGLERAHGNTGEVMWRVGGERVLELGAGAALPSIIAALAGASTVTITDHPSSPALGPSGAISFNITQNLCSATCAVDTAPHEWGVLDSDPWAVQHKAFYTRLIAADCCWMRSQHENLTRTIKWFLAPEGKVWVVAGFHTGRAIVAGFFETASRAGLEIEGIYERDLHSSSEEEGGEVRREWVEVREGEGAENRSRWCVVALLRHASTPQP